MPRWGNAPRWAKEMREAMVDITQRRQEINNLTSRYEYEMNKKLIKIAYDFNKANTENNYDNYDKRARQFADDINNCFVEADAFLWSIQKTIENEVS